MSLKIVSFNVNGLRARIHQLKYLIDTHAPDIIGLQETKVDDPQFPIEEVEKLGYHVNYFGQKGHYGVATLSKLKPLKVLKGFKTDSDDDQKRLITAQFKTTEGIITVINGYFPQGENRSHEVKFPAKRKFYDDLSTWLETDFDSQNDQIIVMGDLNISPEEIDIGIGDVNAKRWLRTGKCSFLPEEREWLARLKSWGLVDSFRHNHPEDKSYSWFDYRSRGFDDTPKRGLRIDIILASSPTLQRLQDSGIFLSMRAMNKPSDHCPIWVDLDLTPDNEV